MGPSNTLSSSTDFPGAPVIRLPCSADFAAGRGGLLQLLDASWSSCRRHSPRQGGAPPQSGCDAPCGLRPPVAGSAPWTRHFRGLLCVHFRYGPMTRSPSPRWVCRRASGVRFPYILPSSYRAPDCSPGGSISHWTRQPFLDAQPDVTISVIRLSDRVHQVACGSAAQSCRATDTARPS
jgi:hypothetical protein